MAVPARGLLMGNRGGRLHGDDRTLGKRRWASKQWIACVLSFKGRRRTVMAPHSYTELFFLDEATALAAGHRPCFECRRGDALAFAGAWQRAERTWERPRAREMDEVLHGQRLDAGGGKRRHRQMLSELPVGAMIELGGGSFLVVKNGLRLWQPSGYGPVQPRPESGVVDVLTPPAILAVISAGYRPMLHPTAHP